jgi:methionine synthase II (cobalamin-independent)
LIERIDGEVEAYKADRETLIYNFLQQYETAKSEARERLKDIYRDTDYPNAEEVKESFYVRSTYLELGVPGQLSKFNPALYQREQEAFKNKLENAATEIQDALRESFRDLVAHMTERLSPSADGKAKIFKDTLVLNLREFMESFTSRNIADDSELQSIVDQARKCLNGTTPEMLRNGPAFRQGIAQSMNEIKGKLDTMIQTKGRKFDFDA